MSMASDKYSGSTAQAIAERIVRAYGPYLLAAEAGTGVPAHWLVGLTGMENPNCREWPDPRSVRFEPGVMAHLFKLQGQKGVLRVGALGKTKTYNNIRPEDLRGLSGPTLQALSRSYGQTQVMGYKVLTLLKGTTLAQLRDPKLHYPLCCRLIQLDGQLDKHVRAGSRESIQSPSHWYHFAHLCHLWNSGREWDDNLAHTHTYSPNYMRNCELVARASIPLLAELRANRDANTAEFRRAYVTNQPTQTTSGPAASAAQVSAPPADQATLASNELADTAPTIDAAGPDAEQKGTSTMPTDEDILGTDPADRAITPTETSDLAGGAGDNSPGPPPVLDTKPGWQTSEAHMTLLFTVLAGGLSLLGLHYTPAQLTNWYETIHHLVTTLGPIAALVPVVFNFITSRGKLKSNALMASAHLGAAQSAMGFSAAGLLGILTGGANIKSPQGIATAIRTAGQLGLPGADKATDLMDKAGGILGQPAQAQIDPARTYTDAQIKQALDSLQTQITEIREQLKRKIT